MRPRPLARVLRLAVRGAGALPASAKRRLAGPPVVVDAQELDVDAQLALKVINASGDTFETKPLARGRAELDDEAYAFGAEPHVATRDIAIPGPAGAMPARVYEPAGSPTGAVVYFHGGGWVLGGYAGADSFARRLVLDADVTVVSVDYRLAPENPFPAAVDDAVAAFRHVRDHAAAFGTTADRVAVGGESAGGNLTCVVAQQTRDDAEGGPCFQVPIFPVTDASRRTRSYELFGTGHFLTAAQMEWYLDHYVPNHDDRRDPRCSPLLAPDSALEGVAPACVVVAGFDPLRDEGLAYAERLREAGVPCETMLFEGFIHAFINAQGYGLKPAQAAQRIAGALRAGLDSR
ncbi:alpha/beta hydrolase [Mariniluteicoccus endophyticus]